MCPCLDLANDNCATISALLLSSYDHILNVGCIHTATPYPCFKFSLGYIQMCYVHFVYLYKTVKYNVDIEFRRISIILQFWCGFTIWIILEISGMLENNKAIQGHTLGKCCSQREKQNAFLNQLNNHSYFHIKYNKLYKKRFILKGNSSILRQRLYNITVQQF